MIKLNGDEDDEIRVSKPDLLTTVFEDGKLVKETSLSEIRERLNDSKRD